MTHVVTISNLMTVSSSHRIRLVHVNVTQENTMMAPTNDLTSPSASQSYVSISIPDTSQESIRQESSSDLTNNSSNRPERPLRILPSASFSQQFTAHSDAQLLQRAVADAGRWAYGIKLVEVWVLNESHTALVRPEHGWWVDPMFHSGCDGICKICQLVDQQHRDFVPADPLAPGEGLPGALWAAVGSHIASFHASSQKSHRRGAASHDNALFREVFKDVLTPSSNHVVWREVKALAMDPDQPFNPRLQLLAEIGLAWAAAVPFKFHGEQGIIVYMAREGVDLDRLRAPHNEAYLAAASSLIGAAYALRGPRRIVVDERHNELREAWYGIKRKIIEAKRLGISLRDVVEGEERKKKQLKRQKSMAERHFNWLWEQICLRTRSTVKKAKGGDTLPSPSFTWSQTIWTLVGSFATLVVVTRLNARLEKKYGTDNAIVLGPFGAMITLLYGLTAAPASQPRNILIGQAVSMSIALAISRFESMSSWMQESVASSLAIAAMVKLGITHPPAGASALLFATGQYGWDNMAWVLLGNFVAIVVATFINNLSDKRQYPTYWGLGVLSHAFSHSIPFSNMSKL